MEPAVYVCLCNGVTERTIREVAAAGCRGIAELTMRTGCGSTCGSCLETAQALLDEVHGAKPDAPALPLAVTRAA